MSNSKGVASGAQLSERDAFAMALRHAGHTLPEIGEVLGISSERVRQLLKRRGIGPRRTTGVNHRLDPVTVLGYARSVDAKSFMDVVRHFKTDRVFDLLRALGVHDALRRLYRLRARAERQRRVIRELQAFVAKEGRVPSTLELTNELRPDLSAFQTITRVFGSYPAALRAAGLGHMPRLRKGRRKSDARSAA